MTRATTASLRTERKALIVHPDMGVLSALQGEFCKQGITAVVARDIPTALLAITQHFFDYAVVASRISEQGDGWPVAGVLRLVFPKAVVLAMAPSADVLTLKSAINNGIDELCQDGHTAEQVVVTALNLEKGKPPALPSARIQ